MILFFLNVYASYSIFENSFGEFTAIEDKLQRLDLKIMELEDIERVFNDKILFFEHQKKYVMHNKNLLEINKNIKYYKRQLATILYKKRLILKNIAELFNKIPKRLQPRALYETRIEKRLSPDALNGVF